MVIFQIAGAVAHGMAVFAEIDAVISIIFIKPDAFIAAFTKHRIVITAPVTDDFIMDGIIVIVLNQTLTTSAVQFFFYLIVLL